MIVESRGIQVLRRGELPNLNPPLREQGIAFAVDERGQVIEILNAHRVPRCIDRNFRSLISAISPFSQSSSSLQGEKLSRLGPSLPFEPFLGNVQRPDLVAERLGVAAGNPDLVLPHICGVFVTLLPAHGGLVLGPILAVF